MNLLPYIYSFFLTFSFAAGPTEDEVKKFLFPVENANPAELKKLGPEVLPIIAKLYLQSDDKTKATLAWVFYEIGWKSTDAKAALMPDVHTKDSKMRLQVQWALGRVSDDADVVETLLDNMQNDDNPLFRDKAACALASDQIHLSEKQKVQLFEGLISALGDPKEDVRNIAIKALLIQTGQTKDFDAQAPASAREIKIQEWKSWLEKYKSNLQ